VEAGTRQAARLGIRVKLNPLRETIHDRRLVVVDDSIVRGNTTKAIVGMLREAGARGAPPQDGRRREGSACDRCHRVAAAGRSAVAALR
jgi:hypothetical protein